MKTIFAIGVSAAALFAASSVANAQSDCVNGWHMIKDNIPARCDMLQPAFAGPGTIEQEAALVSAEAAPLEEPLYTGSIDAGAPVEEPLVTGSIDATEAGQSRGNAEEIPSGDMQFVASRDECQPGYFWMMELNSGNRPVACEGEFVTGSIDTGTPLPGSSEAEQPPRPGGPTSTYSFVASQDECQPGSYWMMELNSGNRPVACE
jgi:hypothetical protein